jgi:hypothetical protein
MLGADSVIGAPQPGLEVSEDRMSPRQGVRSRPYGRGVRPRWRRRSLQSPSSDSGTTGTARAVGSQENGCLGHRSVGTRTRVANGPGACGETA